MIRVGPSIRARWLKMFKITLEIVTLENRGKGAVTSKNPPVPPINHIVKQQFLGSYGMVFWRTEGLGDGLLLHHLLANNVMTYDAVQAHPSLTFFCFLMMPSGIPHIAVSFSL